MKFFTADDFQVSGINADNFDDVAANIANTKLEREAKVFEFPDGKTCRMLFLPAEEIERKPCEHACEGSSVSSNRYFCYKCGKELKPTGWAVVE